MFKLGVDVSIFLVVLVVVVIVCVIKQNLIDCWYLGILVIHVLSFVYFKLKNMYHV